MKSIICITAIALFGCSILFFNLGLQAQEPTIKLCQFFSAGMEVISAILVFSMLRY